MPYGLDLQLADHLSPMGEGEGCLRSASLRRGKTEMVPPLAHEPRRQKTTSSVRSSPEGAGEPMHIRAELGLSSWYSMRRRSVALADQTFPERDGYGSTAWLGGGDRFSADKLIVPERCAHARLRNSLTK
jgi:hypothetical protein